MDSACRVCALFMIMGLLWSCSGDDDGNRPQLNRNPNDFTVTPFIGPAPVNPTLQWQNNGDPDGDVLVFDIYLAVLGNELELLAPNIQETSYVMSESQTLSCNKSYHWQVIAKDGNGGETVSPVNQFTTVQQDEACE